tara:strand:- start:53 stop:1303 length:1251 start_codon:yes stop_codon:yes gene_type:complete
MKNTTFKKIYKTLPKDLVEGIDYPKVNTTPSFWVEINDIVYDEANNQIYNMEKVPIIAQSITDIGINHPPVVWKDTNILIGGHTRHESCKQNGYKYIPIENSKLEFVVDDLDRLEVLTSDNIVRDKTFADRFRAVDVLVGAYFKKYPNITKEDDEFKRRFRGWLSREKMKPSNYTEMIEMREHPVWKTKYYDEVLNPKSKLFSKPEVAYLQATFVYPKMKTRIDLMDNLFNKDDINSLTYAAHNSLKGLKELTIPISEDLSIQPFSVSDRNFFSSGVHATICQWLKTKFNSFDSFENDWIVTDNQDFHDVVSEKDGTGLEVKTRVVKTNTAPSWEPRRFKPGYHFLWAQDDEMDSVYCCMALLSEEDQKPITGTHKIINDRLWELKKDNKVIELVGKMKKDKGELKFLYQPMTFAK